jgi:hypothetical protein
MSIPYETPILFLIFNRIDTTQQVFNQIKRMKPKYLFVAADGPRLGLEGETEKCMETRNIIQQIDWDCELETLFHENNLGCGIAVNTAITWFFKHVQEGIILEDDCYPDLTFFRFCNELLEKYRYKQDIYLIGGTNFRRNISETKDSYYFSNYGQIWGWATWKRAWHMNDLDYFDYNAQNATSKLEHIFQSKSEKKYWNKAFSKCKDGLINTWDYQWLYYIWKNKGLSITPNTNLVVNIGFQINSTHFFLNDSYKTELKCKDICFPLIHPANLKINKEADIFTYKNLYSHSMKRSWRLFRENSIASIFNYYLRRYFI